MKIACVLFVVLIALVNVVAGFRQTWILFRKRISVGNGVIVSSCLGQEEERIGDEIMTIYRPLVEFEYEVAGRMMGSDRISIAAAGTSDRSAAEKRLRFYQEGKRVKVYFNQDNPSEAYLKNPRKHVWTSLFWAIGMAVFGVLMGMMVWMFVP